MRRGGHVVVVRRGIVVGRGGLGAGVPTAAAPSGLVHLFARRRRAQGEFAAAVGLPAWPKRLH